MSFTRRGLAAALCLAPLPALLPAKESPVGNGWSNQKITELTIPTGTTTGERITINVGQDGAILVYNSDGKLIDSIAPALGTAADGTAYLAGITSFDPDDGSSTIIDGTQIIFSDAGMVDVAEISFAVGSKGSYLQVDQGVVGTMVQNDDPNGNSPNSIHTGRYSATVSGASGLATFNHGAAFTPTFGLLTFLGNASQGNWTDAFGTHGFTRTQAQITAYGQGGTPVSNGTVVTFYAMFMV